MAPNAAVLTGMGAQRAIEDIWVHPPAQVRVYGALGTLIFPSAPWAPWWHLLRSGTGWARACSTWSRSGPR